MRRNIIFALAILFMGSCSIHKNKKEEKDFESTKQSLMAHIRFLASDELKGRKAGTPEIKIATRYIVEQFRSYGLQTFSDIPDFMQDVLLIKNTGINYPGQTFTPIHCNNVVGYIQGSDSSLKKEYILLVAHYDHLGIISNPITPFSDTIYNGARDNGIGVTALLFAASEFTKGSTPLRSIIFLASTGEEEGMLGSSYFIEHCPVSIHDIAFVLNNDGGGYNDTTLIRIGGKNEINLPSTAWKTSAATGLNYLSYPGELQYLYKEGDAIQFAEKGIPSITISPGFDKIDDEILKYVHKPADEADDSFNYVYLTKFCMAFKESVRYISNCEIMPFWKSETAFYLIGKQLYRKN